MEQVVGLDLLTNQNLAPDLPEAVGARVMLIPTPTSAHVKQNVTLWPAARRHVYHHLTFPAFGGKCCFLLTLHCTPAAPGSNNNSFAPDTTRTVELLQVVGLDLLT